MKSIEVVAAIILQDGKALATQRGYGDLAGGWEFPGGKMEPGETPEDALMREIREELDVAISVDSFVVTVDHDYEGFHLTMHCYLCTIIEGSLKLLEHAAAKWLDTTTIDQVSWLPADIAVVESIKQQSILSEQQ